MRKHNSIVIVLIFFATLQSFGAAKVHVIAFGKWTTVKSAESDPQEMKVRGLFVDSRLKEYSVGLPHEVTDRSFVVRRAFRLNDALPQESSPRWIWQRGGWILVDRVTGRISQITLPEFDSSVSVGAWYRDYVAYCGISDDGKNLFAMLVQLGRRKAVLKKAAGTTSAGEDVQCSAPEWQRAPMRVTFSSADGEKLTYSVHGRAIDLINESEDDEGE